jgi:hypothetical protein
MTKQLTHLDLVRRDAQALHKKISANIGKAEAATWADVKAVQDEAVALATKMKTVADGEADAMKADLKAAITKLDAAGKLVEDTAIAGKDAIKRTNASLLASARNAALSLSHAVADMRAKAAKAIESKKVSA